MDLSRFGVTLEEKVHTNFAGDELYRGRHPKFPSGVAIKAVRLTSEMPLDKARIGPQMQSKLEHPNIVKVLGLQKYPESPNPHFLLIFTPFYPQGNLSQEIQRRAQSGAPWTEFELLELIEELVSVFTYLEHCQLSLHIQTEKILVSTHRSGKLQPLIGDFRCVELKAPAGQQSISQRAEQVLQTARVAHSRSDILDLALIICELATLQGIQGRANFISIQQLSMRIESRVIRSFVQQMLTADENSSFAELLKEVDRLKQAADFVRGSSQDQIAHSFVTKFNEESFGFFNKKEAVQWIASPVLSANLVFQVNADAQLVELHEQMLSTQLNHGDYSEETLQKLLRLIDILGFKVTASLDTERFYSPLTG